MGEAVQNSLKETRRPTSTLNIERWTLVRINEGLFPSKPAIGHEFDPITEVPMLTMNGLMAGVDRIKSRKKLAQRFWLLFVGFARYGLSICITNACPPMSI